jgi:four helix bundle protein
VENISGQQGEGWAFRTFEDLEVYKKARQFRKDMYGVGKRLPQFEKYELGSQIRRASLSLTNNIAEGHGRYHYLDQIKFQLQARGSLAKLVDDLNLCEDEDYLPIEDVTALKDRAKEVQRLINGYIRYLRDRRSGASLLIRETPGENKLDDDLAELCNDLTS